MVTTSHPDDVLWNGEVSSRPTPFSEETATGYVFNDTTWKQKVLSLGTFLPLNLIRRSQERLQVARALLVIQQCSQLRRVLSIFLPTQNIAAPVTLAQESLHTTNVKGQTLSISVSATLFQPWLNLLRAQLNPSSSALAIPGGCSELRALNSLGSSALPILPGGCSGLQEVSPFRQRSRNT